MVEWWSGGVVELGRLELMDMVPGWSEVVEFGYLVCLSAYPAGVPGTYLVRPRIGWGKAQRNRDSRCHRC